MPGKKDKTKDDIDERVEMKTLDVEILRSEFRRGVQVGAVIGAAIFLASLLLGE